MGVGGEVVNKVKYGEAQPPCPTPYPFTYHFGRNGTPYSGPGESSSEKNSCW